jgi:2',3'-cyclic-nucleotide 2'-phosphodiesterase (5'-nucleotidase family)
MDHRIALDPVVLSRTQVQLDRAATILATPVGELAENLSVHAAPGEPSEVEQLIAAAITEALAQREVKIDGVFHGLFDDKRVCRKGQKTIGDIWDILPYENCIVTGDFTPNELRAILEEVLQNRETRSLAGFRFTLEGQGSNRRLTSLTRADGRLLDSAQRVRIAFNTFDASSGGHRFMKLRELLERPETKRGDHPVQTREALIEYFRRHRVVRLS